MIRNRISHIYRRYPKTFWLLSLATFIDRIGGAIIFPYFALYVTSHFDVGLTIVGKLFAIFAVTSLIGSIIGGALTDKFGRRLLIILGLILSASSSLSMGFVDDLNIFFIVGGFAGLFFNIGGPAQMAMVADLLPEEDRVEGFGILRVIANLAVTIGPAIGGFLAMRSYLSLFIVDAVMSFITAGVVYSFISETKPKAKVIEEQTKSLSETVFGYLVVLRDKVFIAFMFVSMLTVIVYMQMETTLPVYMRDIHGFPPQSYGYLLSLNAGIVVLFQFLITRKIANKPPMIILIIGSAFYMIGFTLFGFVDLYICFMLAMAILTVGEMIINPIAQSLVSRFAPEEMRGRYMAVFELTFIIPSAIGPLLAGVIVDNYDPNWVWYGSGLLCILAIGGFLYLHVQTSDRYTQ